MDQLPPKDGVRPVQLAARFMVTACPTVAVLGVPVGLHVIPVCAATRATERARKLKKTTALTNRFKFAPFARSRFDRPLPPSTALSPTDHTALTSSFFTRLPRRPRTNPGRPLLVAVSAKSLEQSYPARTVLTAIARVECTLHQPRKYINPSYTHTFATENSTALGNLGRRCAIWERIRNVIEGRDASPRIGLIYAVFGCIATVTVCLL